MDFSWELLFELLGKVYQQISGTGQRRWRMIKEAERYLDYAWVDWEYRK